MGKRMVTGSGTAQARGGLLGSAVAVALLASGCTVSFGAQGADCQRRLKIDPLAAAEN